MAQDTSMSSMFLLPIIRSYYNNPYPEFVQKCQYLPRHDLHSILFALKKKFGHRLSKYIFDFIKPLVDIEIESMIVSKIGGTLCDYLFEFTYPLQYSETELLRKIEPFTETEQIPKFVHIISNYISKKTIRKFQYYYDKKEKKYCSLLHFIFYSFVIIPDEFIEKIFLLFDRAKFNYYDSEMYSLYDSPIRSLDIFTSRELIRRKIKFGNLDDSIKKIFEITLDNIFNVGKDFNSNISYDSYQYIAKRKKRDFKKLYETFRLLKLNGYDLSKHRELFFSSCEKFRKIYPKIYCKMKDLF